MIKNVILGDIINIHRSRSGPVNGDDLTGIDFSMVAGIIVGDNVSE